MRLNKLFILYSLFGILMASCIKDEAPNAEADITGTGKRSFQFKSVLQ